MSRAAKSKRITQVIVALSSTSILLGCAYQSELRVKLEDGLGHSPIAAHVRPYSTIGIVGLDGRPLSDFVNRTKNFLVERCPEATASCLEEQGFECVSGSTYCTYSGSATMRRYGEGDGWSRSIEITVPVGDPGSPSFREATVEFPGDL